MHIILTALISAAYIDNNGKVVQQITNVIQEMMYQDSLLLIKSIFHQPISDGINCGKTVHDLLKIALKKATLSHILTSELDSLVANLDN